MSRVVHFEIPAVDIEGAKTFYTEVFDWKLTPWGEGPETYWLITTGEKDTPGIDGGFYKPDGERTGIINTIDVANLDDTIAKVLACGGSIVAPKMPVMGVGWLAYAKDPGGTVFGMMQADPNATM